MVPPPRGWGWQTSPENFESGAPSFNSASNRPAGPCKSTVRKDVFPELVADTDTADVEIIPETILRRYVAALAVRMLNSGQAMRLA
jgi:hypothetical protein